MTPLVAEFLGTMLLVLLGDGICANNNLTGTKGHNSGWLFINAGWGLAVFTAVMCTRQYSGAHLNPAVSVGLAAAGEFPWANVGGYLAVQFAGAFVGALLVYVFYIQHFRITEDADAKLGSFCTGPSIRGLVPNILGEAIGTFVLVFAVLLAFDGTVQIGEESHTIGLGSVGALPVAFVVFVIGMGLGGTTGYAINPARDFSPRLAHAILPIPGKRDSDWGYSWIPVLAPILGGIAAAVLYRAVVAQTAVDEAAMLGNAAGDLFIALPRR